MAKKTRQNRRECTSAIIRDLSLQGRLQLQKDLDVMIRRMNMKAVDGGKSKKLQNLKLGV